MKTIHAIQCKDISGNEVLVDATELLFTLSNDTEGQFMLFGMDFQCILRMRFHYQKMCGPIPITCESIDGTFGGCK